MAIQVRLKDPTQKEKSPGPEVIPIVGVGDPPQQGPIHPALRTPIPTEVIAFYSGGVYLRLKRKDFPMTKDGTLLWYRYRAEFWLHRARVLERFNSPEFHEKVRIKKWVNNLRKRGFCIMPPEEVAKKKELKDARKKEAAAQALSQAPAPVETFNNPEGNAPSND
jgi:hypothetical protein